MVLQLKGSGSWDYKAGRAVPLPTKAVPQYMNKKSKAGLGMVSRDSQGFRSTEMSIVTRQVQGQDGKSSLWVSESTRYIIRHRHIDNTAWARTLQCYSQTKGGRTLLLPNLCHPALSQQSDPRFQSHIISELALRTCSQSPGKEKGRKSL